MFWHSETVEVVKEELRTNAQSGLTDAKVAEKRVLQAENLPASEGPSFWRQWIGQWRRPGWLCLSAAAVIWTAWQIWGFPYRKETPLWQMGLLFLLMAVYTLSATVAQRSVQRRRQRYTAIGPQARVLRNGEWQSIPSEELVAGDVVEVLAGELIPADGRLLEAEGLYCDEAALTGKTEAVCKDASASVAAISPLSERRNMIYAGCAVLTGRARAMVTEIGEGTEVRKTMRLHTERFPIPRGIQTAQRAILAAVFAVTAWILLYGLFGNDAMMTAVSAVTLIAAALPLCLRGALSASAEAAVDAAFGRLSPRAWMKNAASPHKLAEVKTICMSDDVFTKGDVQVAAVFTSRQYFSAEDNELSAEAEVLLRLAALCASSEDQADGAVASYAARHGFAFEVLAQEYPRLGEVAYDPVRRRVAVEHLIGGQRMVIVRGAAEAVLPLCGEVPEAMLKAQEEFLQRKYQVLAVAYKRLPQTDAPFAQETWESELISVGLIALHYTAEQSMTSYWKKWRQMGVRPMLLTDADEAVARAEAENLGLLSEKVGGEVLTGRTVAEKARALEEYRQQGQAIAVVGRKTGDLPLLRQADVGIAVGQESTARIAADVTVASETNVIETLTAVLRETHGIRNGLFLTVARQAAGILVLALMLIAGPWVTSPLSPACILWLAVMSLYLPEWFARAQAPGRFCRPVAASFAMGISAWLITLLACTVGASWLSLPSETVPTVMFLTSAVGLLTLFSAFPSALGKRRLTVSLISFLLTAAAVLVPPIREALWLTALPLNGWWLVLATGLILWIIQAVWQKSNLFFGGKSDD